MPATGDHLARRNPASPCVAGPGLRGDVIPPALPDLSAGRHGEPGILAEVRSCCKCSPHPLRTDFPGHFHCFLLQRTPNPCGVSRFRGFAHFRQVLRGAFYPENSRHCPIHLPGIAGEKSPTHLAEWPRIGGFGSPCREPSRQSSIVR